MNRIVREHYPIAKLPLELREGFAPDAQVRIIIDSEVAQSAALTDAPLDGHFTRYRHLRRSNFASDQDVDAYVRSLRDEV